MKISSANRGNALGPPMSWQRDKLERVFVIENIQIQNRGTHRESCRFPWLREPPRQPPCPICICSPEPSVPGHIMYMSTGTMPGHIIMKVLVEYSGQSPLTHSPSPHPPPSPPSPPPCPLPNMHMSAGALPGNIIDMSAGGGGGPDAPPPPVSMKPAAAMCCFVHVGERTRKQTTKFDEMSYGVFCWGKHFDETNYVFSGGGEQKQMICLGRVTLSRFPGKSFGGTNGEPGVPAG